MSTSLLELTDIIHVTWLQCFEDIYLDSRPQLKLAIYYLNIAFAVIFTIEMLLKWVGIGFKMYFTNFWTILDFCIVVVGSIGLQSHVTIYK